MTDQNYNKRFCEPIPVMPNKFHSGKSSFFAAPILHDIKCSTDWPKKISEITSFALSLSVLHRRLMKRREFVSLGCWDFDQEARKLSLFAVRGEDAMEPTSIDIILILRCVASSAGASQGHLLLAELARTRNTFMVTDVENVVGRIFAPHFKGPASYESHLSPCR